MCRLFYFANRSYLSAEFIDKRAYGKADYLKVRRFVIVLHNSSLYRFCKKTNSIWLDSSDFCPTIGRFRRIQ